jgi:MFS family permease
MKVSRAAMWTIYGVVFMDLMQLSLIFPLLPSIASTFGAGPWGIGMLVSGTAVFEGLAAPLLGALADRFGRKPVLVWATFGSTVAAVGTGVSANFWMLLLSRLVQGACGGTMGIAQAYIADVTTFEERSEYMSGFMAALMTGLALGPVCGGYLTVWLGWRGAIGAAAILSFLNFLTVVQFFSECKQPETLEDKGEVDKAAADGRPIMKLLTRQATGVMGAMAEGISAQGLSELRRSNLQRRHSESFGTSLPPMLSPEVRSGLLRHASVPAGTAPPIATPDLEQAHRKNQDAAAAPPAVPQDAAKEPSQQAVTRADKPKDVAKQGAFTLGWPAWMLCFTSFLFSMGQPGIMTIGVLYITEMYTDGDIDAATLDFANLFTLIGITGIFWNIFLFKPLRRCMSDLGLIIFGGVARSLGWVFCAYAPNVLLFNASVIMFSLGGNCMFPVVQTILTEIVPEENRGAAMGINQMFQNISRALGPLFMVPLYDINIKLPFLATAFGGFFIIFLTLIARHYGLHSKRIQAESEPAK